MNIFVYITVLSIGAAVGYFLGLPGLIGMIAGAIAATLILYDMNARERSPMKDEVS